MLALEELINAGKVEDDYFFREALAGAAKKSATLREQLERRAADGHHVAAEALEDARQEEASENLEALAVRLAIEVFPADWPVGARM